VGFQVGSPTEATNEPGTKATDPVCGRSSRTATEAAIPPVLLTTSVYERVSPGRAAARSTPFQEDEISEPTAGCALAARSCFVGPASFRAPQSSSGRFSSAPPPRSKGT